eukprot:SAG11_NODE_1439_length_4907_cov_2.082571_2_plen_148_part_00
MSPRWASTHAHKYVVRCEPDVRDGRSGLGDAAADFQALGLGQPVLQGTQMEELASTQKAQAEQLERQAKQIEALLASMEVGDAGTAADGAVALAAEVKALQGVVGELTAEVRGLREENASQATQIRVLQEQAGEQRAWLTAQAKSHV